MSSGTPRKFPAVDDPWTPSGRIGIVMAMLAMALGSIALSFSDLPGSDLGDRLGSLGFLLAILVSLGSVVAFHRADAQHFRNPPVLGSAWTDDGRWATVLPRSEGPTRATWRTTLWAAPPTALLSAASFEQGVWGFGVAFAGFAACLGGGYLWHRKDSAGSLQLSPAHLVHEIGRDRWSAPWNDVAAVETGNHHVLVRFRPGRRPRVEGRLVQTPRVLRPHRDALKVHTRHLAGGEPLVSYLVGRAIVDPALRARLGTPDLVRLARPGESRRPTTGQAAVTSNSTHSG